ncbi:calcium-binding protein, partial [Aquabacterium sp.]|uniref:calcium-binding protein n=1 Tax=Aquabacterium sp. TaxID=1872578 RepID=UPI003D6CC4C6
MSDFIIKQVATTVGNYVGGAVGSAVAGAAVGVVMAEAEAINLYNNLADGTATSADVIAVTAAIEGAIFGAGVTLVEAGLLAGGIGASIPLTAVAIAAAGAWVFYNRNDVAIQDAFDTFIDGVKNGDQPWTFIPKIIDDYQKSAYHRNVSPGANNNYRDATTYRPRDPLAIDLTGNGIETVGINPASPILFDHNGDGIKTGTGWLQATDAWLVRDLNGNGTIDSGLELFGVDTNITVGGVTRKATSGFEALSALNTNGDTVFDASDTAFSQVRVWQDLNQDGISQAGELSTLAAKNIASISLTPTTTSTPLGSTGNSVTGQAVVTRTGGLQSTVIDSVSIAGDSSANNLNLVDNPFYREFPHDVTVTATAKGLPEMRGSGKVRDLREAMSLDTPQGAALATIVTQFKQATTRDAQMALIDQLIQKWGATSLMQTSASATTNASSIAAFASSQPDLYKKIIALEQFNGAMSLTQWANATSVNIAAPVVALLNNAYGALKESVYSALVVQTRLQPYFDAVKLVVDDAGIRFDFSALDTKLDAYKTTDAKNALIDLVELSRYGFNTLGSVGFDGLGKLGQWVNALATDSPLRTTLTELRVFAGTDATGSGAQDIYVGNAAGNSFSAGEGDDLLFGDNGNDTLYGEGGHDTLDGGAGADNLNGGLGNNTFVFGKGDGQDYIYSVNDASVG